MKSKEALEIDQSMMIPNTAKSYFNQQIGNRRSSGRSKAGNSNINESVELIKKTFVNANNLFNTTAATSNQFNSTDSGNSKHKRSKTQKWGGKYIPINTNNFIFNSNLVYNDGTSLSNYKTKEESLIQLKAEMENLYSKTLDRKYKLMSNSKIIYVPKGLVKKKSNKRCNSTDGTSNQPTSIKKKIASVTKNAKQAIVNNKNRKYFNPSTKDGQWMINASQNIQNNPHQEYMDQMKRKQRYTAFDGNVEGKQKLTNGSNDSMQGKNTSFSGTHYGGSNKLI